MTKQKRLELIQEAKEMGLKSIVIDKVTYNFDPIVVQPQITDEEAKSMLAPLPYFDQLTDEEVLMWSTPRYDEIQQQKELRKQQIKDREDLTNG